MVIKNSEKVRYMVLNQEIHVFIKFIFATLIRFVKIQYALKPITISVLYCVNIFALPSIVD